MPPYSRARQDYAIPSPNTNPSNRNTTHDRAQPFREPNSHFSPSAATGSNRQKRVSADHNPSPVTPAVTGIVYPTEEDDEVEPDELAQSIASRAEHLRSYPITIDQTYNHHDNYTNNRSAHQHATATRYNPPMSPQSANIANRSSSQDDTSSDNVGGLAPAGENTLDRIWDAIREKKARKMAKERPKVESLEEITGELALTDYPLYPGRERQYAHPQGGLSHSYQQPSAAQIMDNMEAMSVPMPIAQDHVQQAQESTFKQVKKRKSLVSFRESKDGRSMNATIDLPPEVKKQDIHISFNTRRLVVSWMIIDITEWEEDDGRIVRERVEQIFQRTLPLGEGTKYEEIKSYMIKNRLIIRYPNMRCIRVEPKHTDDA